MMLIKLSYFQNCKKIANLFLNIRDIARQMYIRVAKASRKNMSVDNMGRSEMNFKMLGLPKDTLIIRQLLDIIVSF